MLPGLKPENAPKRTVAEIPVLTRSLPVPVTALHQIEITSDCNLRCVYCPSPKMGKVDGFRGRVNMTLDHFEQALKHVRYFVARGTQSELNLAGIGESTLHPDFPELVRLARRAVGDKVELTLATNGLTTNEAQPRAREIADVLACHGVTTYVSQHRPEKAGPAVAFLEERGVKLGGFSTDPALNAMDWAGQVEWKGRKQKYEAPCQWIRQGMVMALSDGRLTACCLDAKGSGVIGHVSDEVGTLTTKPYDLCKSCHQHVRIAGYDQRGEA